MKIEHFERLAKPSAVAGGKKHIVSRYMTSQYSQSPIHFSCKKGPITTLIKKLLFVIRELLTFSDSDHDFVQSCNTRAQSSSSLESQLSSLVVQCTIISTIKYLLNYSG